MKRTLVIGALVTAGLVAACDDDSMGPATTGSISIHVTVAPPPAASAAREAAASAPSTRAIAAPRLATKNAGEQNASAMRLGPASGAGAGVALDRRVVRINATPGEQGSKEGASRQPEQQATAAPESKPPAAPAAPSAIDNATLRVIGPTNVTRQNLAPGDTEVVEGLTAGTYTVVLEGYAGGLVDHFAINTGVLVRSGQNTTVNVTFNSFRPAIGAITSPTTAVPFVFSWPPVPNAEAYTVQLDSDPAFGNPTAADITGTTAVAKVVTPGTYYVRARAINNTYVASGGRWGDSRSVQVIEDTQSGPNPAAAAYIGFMDGQGPMTVTDLNILPEADEDWFSVTVCELDTLKIETFAGRLSEPSPLDTYLELWDPSASTMIAENDDIDFEGGNWDSYIEAEIPADGDYRIGVFGVSSDPVGSYELTVDVILGPNNDGTQCTTVHGPAEVVVTPAGASIVGVGNTQQFTAEAFDDRGIPLTGLTFNWTSLNPDIATVNATGVVTAVANGQVVIEAATDGVKGYAVVTVTVPGTTQAGVWANIAGFGTHGWGTNESDIWVCSGVDEMSHWDGSAWTAFPVTMPGCREVWGTGPDDVFAAGITGSMIHWDGSEWVTMTTGSTANLSGLWGSAPDNVYATGAAGTILHYDGGTWASETSPTTEQLSRAWGTAADDIYAIGSAGTIIHYNGTAWSTVTSPTAEVLRGMWGSSPTDIFVVGDHGTVLRFDGSWNVMTTPTTDSLQDVGGANSSDLYGVGTQGVLWRYDGADWAALLGPTQNYLWDAWASPGGDMYAFGNDGLFRGYRGATVSVTGPTYTLTQLGQQVELTAAANDADANPISGVNFDWRSDNESVATVDGNGLVTAVSEGIANIWATAPGGATAVRPITVQIPAYIVVTPGGTTISGLGNTFGFSAQAYDAGNNPVNGLTYAWNTLNPNIATIDGSSGVATAVEVGQTVVRVRTTGVDGYAVLTVTNPSATRLNVWSTMSSPVTTYLYGVWGTAANNVYAVGESGTIVRFNGTSWSPMTSGTTNFLRDVSGLSANEIYAVGDGGVILRYNGTSWSAMTNPTTDDLYRVWAASPTNVFAVGVNGRILRYNGSAWTAMTSPTTNLLVGVWGTSATDVFAVGLSGTVIHYDGTSWTTMTSNTANLLYGLWGTASNNVFAVGYPGQISRYNGSSWSNMTSPTSNWLWSLWGTSGSDVYTVGNSGTIMQYNGSTWEIMGSPTTNPIRAIWGTSQGDVFAVGSNGTILRGGRGATVASVDVAPKGATISMGSTRAFSAQPRDASGNPISFKTASWTSLNTDVATVNAAGVATATRDGQATIGADVDGVKGYALVTGIASAPTPVNAWVTQASPVTSYVTRVWGARATDAFAINNGATDNLMRYNGTSWTASTVSSGGLWGLWGTSATNVYAAGMSGRLHHYNGSTWSTVTTGTTQFLRSIWGSAPNDVWVVGSTGTILHYDGSTWSTVESGTTASLLGIWGTASNDIFVVGSGGTILHYDGVSWSQPFTSGTTNQLSGVWGTSPTNVWAVGSSGTILHYTGSSTWQAVTSPTTSGLWHISGTGASDIYAVSQSSLILRYNGSAWVEMEDGTSANFEAVWGTANGSMWAAGSNGVIRRGLRGAPLVSAGYPTQLSSSSPFTANYYWSQSVTLSQPIELTRLGHITATSSGGSAVIGIYTDASGKPGSLVAQTAAFTIATGRQEFGAFGYLPPGTYWITVHYSVAPSLAFESPYDQSCYQYNAGAFSATLPTSHPTGTAYSCGKINMYLRGYVVPSGGMAPPAMLVTVGPSSSTEP